METVNEDGAVEVAEAEDPEIHRYYDGNDCIAVIAGEPAALIGRVYAVDLIEAVPALIP